MKKKKDISKVIVIISLILYLLLLTWIIVFKFRLNFSSLKYIRSINLIPFKANGVVNGIKETLINLVLFIPLGMYLQFIIRKKKNLKLPIVIIISIIYEILQYVLHIGVSDITDVIMNSLGGIIGMTIMFIFYTLLVKKIDTNRLDKVIGYLSLIIPIVIFGTLFLL